MELWQLNHPGHPTRSAGGVLDRVMFYPGKFTPAGWFSEGGGPAGGREDTRGDEVFPARVLADMAIGDNDHYPIFLVAPIGKEDTGQAGGKDDH